MQVKISQAAAMLTQFIRAKLVPMLIGSPGMGKSQIVHQLAAEHNLEVIDMRLAQCDPTDLLGLPRYVNEKATYAPMATFPLESDPLPKGKSGWLLFLDEFTSASPAVQAASYKLVLDRMIGQHKLHPNLAIVCAGNLETDNAIVQPMSTALQSRLVHMELVIDHLEWVNWAASHDVDHRITSFINFKPGQLYTFSPDHSDHTYASPRTWEFANRILKITTDADHNLLPLLAGTLSEGVAREFLAFTRIYQNLPTIAAITENPEGIAVPQEPSILFALTGAIAHHLDKGLVAPLMKYIKRLPVEFQVVCLRDAVRRNKHIMAEPAVQQWIQTSAAELF
jgi:hypothetical protein